MSQGKVGPWEITFKSVPRGPYGTASAQVKDTRPGGTTRQIEISWRRDGDGVWIEFPDQVRGYDIAGEPGDDGLPLYQMNERGGHPFWAGLVLMRAGEELAQAGAGGAKKNLRVRAQMPGKILRLLVKEGATVEKGQPLAVMEAMKMENEIRAAQGGRVATVKVSEGQAVETGADLMLIEPSGS